MSGDATDSDAYIRVRVPDGPRRDGSVLVYLPDGTGLVVNSSQLLRSSMQPLSRVREATHPALEER